MATLPAAADAEVRYTFQALGNLPGATVCVPLGINNLGQVVGFSYDRGPERAFVWSNGVMSDLGPLLPGPNNRATGINDHGQVVGYSPDNNYLEQHGFLYSDGNVTDLGTLGGPESPASSINNLGQVVGESRYTSYLYPRSYLWQNGQMRVVFSPPGSANWASGINDLGQVAGTYNTQMLDPMGNPILHAFLNDGKTPIDLGTLGGTYSTAYGLNNRGQVVGFSTTTDQPSPRHAFLYEGGVMKDLGTMGNYFSEADAINDQGQVVGYFGPNDPLAAHYYAFVYSDGTMTDLNQVVVGNHGLLLNLARGINNRGQIIGESAGTGFLLTPHLLADANDSGAVGLDDLLVLAQHYGQAGGWAEGDFDGDGTVGFADLLVLAQHYRTGGAAATVSAVAEPSLPMMVSMLLLSACKRSRSV